MVDNKPQSGPTATVIRASDKQEVRIPLEQLPNAIASGSFTLDHNKEYNMVDGSGQAWSVPGSSVRQALMQGYSLETPKQTAVREYLKENDGIKGTLKVGLSQFADETLMGIPELIYERTGNPDDVAKWEALKKEHAYANAVGGIAGFAANLAALKGLGATAKIGAAGVATEEAMAKAGAGILSERLMASGAGKAAAETASKFLTNKTAQAAANMGVQSMLYTAPVAVTEAMLGDPEEAGESLAIAGLTGVGLGVLGRIGGKGAWKVRNVAAELTNDPVYKRKALQLAGVSTLEPEMNQAWDQYKQLNQLSNVIPDAERTKRLSKAAPELLEWRDSIKQSYQPLAESFRSTQQTSNAIKGFGALGGFGSAMSGGSIIGGGLAGAAAGLALDATAKALASETAMKLYVQAIDAGTTAVLAGTKSGAIPKAVGRNSFSNMSDEETLKVADGLRNLQADPELLSQLSQFSNTLEQADFKQTASAYHAAEMRRIGYLADNAPQRNIPRPFLYGDNAALDKPQPQELARFRQVLAIAENPFYTYNLINDGTLGTLHVDALRTMYPKTYQKMMNQLMQGAFTDDGKMKALPLQKRRSLELFFGMKAQNAYQDFFSKTKKEPEDRGTSKAIKVPDTALSTTKLTYR